MRISLATTLVITFALAGAAACGGSSEESSSTGQGTSTSSSTGSTGQGGSTTGAGGQGGGATTGAGGQGGATSGQGGSGGFDPAQDPTVEIYHPGDGEMRQVNVDIPFIGAATDPQDGNLTGGSLVWASDLDGVIGTGEMLNAPLTTVGTHVITLVATDSDGNSASDSISLVLTP